MHRTRAYNQPRDFRRTHWELRQKAQCIGPDLEQAVAGEVHFSFLPLSSLLFTYIYNHRKSPLLISSTFLVAPGCPQQEATFSIPSLMLLGASSLLLIRFVILMFDD